MAKLRDKQKNVICLCVIGAAFLTLLWRSFYSFNWSDESFYLTTAHRLWIGERMFADEWHRAQLLAPILLPFYAAFQTITGGNTGVYLFFRLLYLVISTALAITVYHVVKKYHTVSAALFCALVYLLYSRANISGMSYYNLTLTFATGAVILIYDCVCSGKINKGKLIVSGIFLALAVSQTPYLCIPYVIVVFFLIWKYRKTVWKSVLWNGLGVVLTAAVYLVWLLRMVSVREILENIPHILNEPELQTTNALLVLPLMMARIAWRFRLTILFSALIIAYLLIKKAKRQVPGACQKRWIWGINTAVFAVNMFLSQNLIGCINLAFCIFAIPVILMYGEWNKENRNTLVCFGTGGFGLSFAFSFSSNTGLDAMLIGFILLTMGCTMILFRSRVSKTVMVIAALTVLQTAGLRVGSVYRDAPIAQLNTQITRGPAKYLRTTREHAEQYDTLLTAVKRYVREDDIVFYTKQCSWSYLCAGSGYGTPYAWRMSFDNPRLEEYLKANPQKIPTCVFVLRPEYGKFESSMIQGNEKDDFPNINVNAGYLYDYMIQHDYEVIEDACATIYRANIHPNKQIGK